MCRLRHSLSHPTTSEVPEPYLSALAAFTSSVSYWLLPPLRGAASRPHEDSLAVVTARVRIPEGSSAVLKGPVTLYEIEILRVRTR